MFITATNAIPLWYNKSSLHQSWPVRRGCAIDPNVDILAPTLLCKSDGTVNSSIHVFPMVLDGGVQPEFLVDNSLEAILPGECQAALLGEFSECCVKVLGIITTFSPSHTWNAAELLSKPSCFRDAVHSFSGNPWRRKAANQ